MSYVFEFLIRKTGLILGSLKVLGIQKFSRYKIKVIDKCTWVIYEGRFIYTYCAYKEIIGIILKKAFC